MRARGATLTKTNNKDGWVVRHLGMEQKLSNIHCLVDKTMNMYKSYLTKSYLKISRASSCRCIGISGCLHYNPKELYPSCFALVLVGEVVWQYRGSPGTWDLNLELETSNSWLASSNFFGISHLRFGGGGSSVHKKHNPCQWSTHWVWLQPLLL